MPALPGDFTGRDTSITAFSWAWVRGTTGAIGTAGEAIAFVAQVEAGIARMADITVGRAAGITVDPTVVRPTAGPMAVTVAAGQVAATMAASAAAATNTRAVFRLPTIAKVGEAPFFLRKNGAEFFASIYIYRKTAVGGANKR